MQAVRRRDSMLSGPSLSGDRMMPTRQKPARSHQLCTSTSPLRTSTVLVVLVGSLKQMQSARYGKIGNSADKLTSGL